MYNLTEVVSNDSTETILNISWLPPDNTYQRLITNYVVFVGGVEDEVSQSSFTHLMTDNRYTKVRDTE